MSNKLVTVKKHIDKRRLEVEYFDIKNKKVVCLIPYGMFCKIGTEINGFAFQEEGNEDSLFVIPADFINLETLENNEVFYGIPSKLSRIKFKNIDKIIITSNKNLDLIAQQKILIKNTAENLKGLIGDLIDAFNNLATITQTTASSHPDAGHTHAIVITGVTNALSALKTRFDSLLTDTES